MGIIDDIRKEIAEMEQEEHSLAMIILKEYKSMVNALEKTNTKLIYVILSLLIIIGLFVGGLVYVVTNFDFTYEDISAETSSGNACIGENCINGESTN